MVKITTENIEVVVDKIQRCIDLSGAFTIIIAKKDEVGANMVEENMTEEEVRDFLNDNLVEYIEFPSSDYFCEPEPNKWIVIYSEDNTIEVGEDPADWDYPLYCYSYWDGSNYKEIIGEYIEDVTEVAHLVVRDPKTNYGRAINYYIFKDESDEYIVGKDNEGYYDPITIIYTKNQEIKNKGIIIKIISDIPNEYDEYLAFSNALEIKKFSSLDEATKYIQEGETFYDR